GEEVGARARRERHDEADDARGVGRLRLRLGGCDAAAEHDGQYQRANVDPHLHPPRADDNSAPERLEGASRCRNVTGGAQGPERGMNGLAHIPEKPALGLDPGWTPVFRQGYAPLMRLVMVLSMIAAGVIVPAQAQRYPSKTIEIVVSYAPGGSTDLIARAV